MSAIYILWLRELKRYTRSRAQIVASLGNPLLYLLVLGFGLGPVFKRAGNGDYLQFVAPGVIGMTVLFSSIFSGLGILWDRSLTLERPVIHVVIGPAGSTTNVPSLRDLPAGSGPSSVEELSILTLGIVVAREMGHPTLPALEVSAADLARLPEGRVRVAADGTISALA